MAATSESAKNNIQKILVGAVGFFIIMFLYANEFSWYANTFGRNQMILISLLIGALVGLGVGYKLQRENQEVIERFQIYIGAIVIGAILMPLFFSLTNRVLSFRPVVEESVEFVKSDKFTENRFGLIPQEKPDGYFAFVIRKGNLTRLMTRTPIYQEAQKGDRVLLPIKKGIWGYEIAYPHLLHE